jgi:hypothetical protein
MKPAKIAMFAVVALCLLMFFRGNVSGYSLRESAEAAIDVVQKALTHDPACSGKKCNKPGQTAKMVNDKCQCS